MKLAPHWSTTVPLRVLARLGSACAARSYIAFVQSVQVTLLPSVMLPLAISDTTDWKLFFVIVPTCDWMSVNSSVAQRVLLSDVLERHRSAPDAGPM